MIDHDPGAGHAERPERLGAVLDALRDDATLDLEAFAAPEAEQADLLRVHSHAYLSGIRGAAPASGRVRLDPDTIMSPGSLEASLRAAGASIAAVRAVAAGDRQRAFCAVRPPGHHAEPDRAMGFCVFSNLAVAARAAQAAGLARVAVVDFDVHHGNGSEDIFRGDDRVLMCSTFEQGLYPFTGDDAVGPNMVNIGLPSRSGGEKFRAAVTDHWLPALDAFAPQLVFISAGFDGHREDDLGNLALVEADFAWVTTQLMAVAHRHCQGRVVSCLEGGYALSALGRSAEAHVRVMMGAD